jgi:fused signal recognition particle receptor
VFRAHGKTVLLCAADTFRAAAIEQLEIWGQRTGTEVIKTKPGGDPSAVLFDALQSARARNTNYVIVDTAGRLHTKVNLMEELKKIRRVLERQNVQHVRTLLVLDASTGQNAIIQGRAFKEATGLDGLILAKLDGTAKGGVLVSLAEKYGIPIHFIGVGESAEDLRPFRAEDFARGLMGVEAR